MVIVTLRCYTLYARLLILAVAARGAGEVTDALTTAITWPNGVLTHSMVAQPTGCDATFSSKPVTVVSTLGSRRSGVRAW